MFKRKDWVHSKKGRGGGLEDSSSSGSSSSSDDDSGSEDGGERLELQGPPSSDDEKIDSDDEKIDSDDEKNDSEESSGSEELDAEDLAALRDDEDDDDEDIEDLELGSPEEQARTWREAGEGGTVVRGRALTCVPCARTKKVLLLNSVMLYQHMASKHHKKLEKAEGCEAEPFGMFRFAESQSKKGLVSGGETHAERLARIKKVGTGEKKKNGRKDQRKRKPRLGKRQRQEAKAERERQK